MFPEPLLFMLVLGREGRVSWDEMDLQTRIEKLFSYSISYLESDLKSPNYILVPCLAFVLSLLFN